MLSLRGEKRRSSAERWETIRGASFQMIYLSRRRDGLWGVPTIPGQVTQTYALPNSREDGARSQYRFGHPSITETWNALCALDRLGDKNLDVVASRALRAIEGHRDSAGGYGTPWLRRNQVEINAVPRHTAMAALSHLMFSSAGQKEKLVKHLQPTMEWLLSRQLKGGGWPYDFSGQSADLGFLSTASSIAATCQYLKLLPSSAALRKRLQNSACRAFESLKACQRDGAWSGDGSPPSHQILDAAFTLRLLMVADFDGVLSSVLQVQNITTDETFSKFLGAALRQGWPDRIGQNSPTGVSTVSGLEITQAAKLVSRFTTDDLQEFEGLVLSEWGSGALSARATSWDWQMLGLLAGLRCGPISASEQISLIGPVEAALSADKDAAVRGPLRKLPKEIRVPAIFALREGRALSKTKVWAWIGGKVGTALDKSLDNFIAWLVIAIMGLLIAALILHKSPREYIVNKVAKAAE